MGETMMTAKEVEHFLIENDFIYVPTTNDNFLAYWKHRKLHVSVADKYIEETPNDAYEFLQRQLADRTEELQ